MLPKNTNFWLNTMLMNAFFPKNGEYGSRLHVYAPLEKLGKFNNFLRFRASFGKILRVIDSEKVREVH